MVSNLVMWFYNKETNVAVACLPKNGTHTISSFFYGEKVANEAVLSATKRVVWIRHPVDRLISAYSFFKTLIISNRYKGKFGEKEIATWTSFVDYILSGHNDVHWDSQVEQLSLDGVYLGTHTYKFCNIMDTWKLHFDGRLPHLNGYKHVDVDITYRFAEILKHFSKDFHLYNTLEH